MHPGGDFVLATTRGSDRIRAFSVDPVTGELVQVSERFTGFQPNQVVVDPLGRFALVRHEFDATPGSEKTLLASYIIDAQSGVLTAGVSFDLLTTNATQMTLSPLGKNLYLTLSAPFPTVLHCSVNTTTGKPSLVGTADAGTTPVALRIDPRGERLYVVSQGSADVTLFDIDPLNGTLSAVTAFLAGATANALSFSDDGAELYVVDPVARDVTVHAIDPLTGESTSEETVRTRSGSSALTHIAGTQGIARRATDLYVANELSGDVASYSITQSTGELEDGNLPPLVAGTLPSGLVVDPLGRFVYVACAGSNEIVGFGIQGDGRLIDLMLPTPFAGGDPRHMAIDLAGRYLYVTVDFFDLLVAYSIQSDGSLVVHNSRALADDPESIVVDPTGTFVFITHAGNGTTELGEIASYAINSQNGNLTQLPSQDAPGHPASLAFNPAGTRAYVTFHDTDRVQPFDVSFSAGLTMIGAGSITQNEPREVELTRDGRFAFATFEDSISQGGLLLYDVNATTGELFNSDNQAFQWRDAVAAGVGPQLVEVTPDGAYVYVLAQTSEEIRAFTSDPVTGLTSALETESPGLVPIGMGLRVVIE
jgi:6-phosphogluconolactonase (cycloisomerase 2 family)